MLDAKRLGLAGGILWGLCMFFTTWAHIQWGYGEMMINLLSDVYPGFTATPVGSLVGLGYGFLDGGIGLFILAWLYNKIKL